MKIIATLLLALFALLFSSCHSKSSSRDENDVLKDIPITKGLGKSVVEERLKARGAEFSTDAATGKIHAILRGKPNTIGVSKSLQIEVAFGPDGLVSEVVKKKVYTGP